MICKHQSELPSQVLTNRLCCVLIHAPSLYRQRKNIPINANRGGGVRLNPAAVNKVYNLVIG